MFDGRGGTAGEGDLILPGRFLASLSSHWNPWCVISNVPNTLRDRQEGHVCFWDPPGQQWGVRGQCVWGPETHQLISQLPLLGATLSPDEVFKPTWSLYLGH